MQNVLGTCLTLAILGGGFALTGDLGRLASRGLRVIQATDVPDDEAPIPVTAAPGPAPERPALPDQAIVIRSHRHGLDAVDVTTLAAGSRIHVWLGEPGQPAGGATRCLALDLIDASSGEALVSDVPPPPAPGLPAMAPAPPCRVLVAGSGPAGTITRGGTLTMRSQGIAGGGDRESFGPIVALEISR